MPLINANTVVVNTGNIFNSKELKKNAILSPSEEVFNSITSTFHTWLQSEEADSEKDSDYVLCVSPTTSKIDSSDRVHLKISVKVFLEEYSSEYLISSISQVMSSLDVKTIDSLIMALPSDNEGKVSVELIKPLWTELEKYVLDGKIITVGVSDLDTPELMELFDWAKVKPSTNQVNLVSCCVMPPEMISFAKDNDIQLLTHNDPKVILSSDMLLKILEPSAMKPEEWKMNWIVRYSVIVKCRGIIQNKGYLFRAGK